MPLSFNELTAPPMPDTASVFNLRAQAVAAIASEDLRRRVHSALTELSAWRALARGGADLGVPQATSFVHPEFRALLEAASAVEGFANYSPGSYKNDGKYILMMPDYSLIIARWTTEYEIERDDEEESDYCSCFVNEQWEAIFPGIDSDDRDPDDDELIAVLPLNLGQGQWMHEQYRKFGMTHYDKALAERVKQKREDLGVQGQPG